MQFDDQALEYNILQGGGGLSYGICSYNQQPPSPRYDTTHDNTPSI